MTWEGIIYKSLGNDSISLSEELYQRTPLQMKTMLETTVIGNGSGLLLLERMGKIDRELEEETKARRSLQEELHSLQEELHSLQEELQQHRKSTTSAISRHDDTLSFLSTTSRRHSEWLRDIVKDERRAGSIGLAHRTNRITTIFEWVGLPHVSGAWDFRNELVHGGDVLTDASLLPALLLHKTEDDFDMRILDAFQKAYGLHLDEFKQIADNASKELIDAINMACTVRVVTNWQRPARRTAKSCILNLASEMVAGKGDSATYSEMLWIYGGRGYAS